MAYFLKKCTKKNRTYLSIVNSFYDATKNDTAHKTYKSFGSLETMLEQGIKDPIAYLETMVKELNEKKEITHKITTVAPYKYAGHFIIKSVLDKIEIKPIIDLFTVHKNFKFDLYDVLTSLIYSRIIKPLSKHKTFYEVIPYLEKDYSFSYDQLLEGLDFFGQNYEKFVEIFTKLIAPKYSINTKNAYFDCTNFYFEIDKEDDFRKKGPSKENRPLPLLGMGLLLDGNQIPIGLNLFPGNESEKPKIREIIERLKQKNDLKTKIVQVADKGLNCARNIYAARIDGDGYIFSKSCKTLPETEKAWIFSSNDYKPVLDNQNNVLYYIKDCIDDYTYNFEKNGQKLTFTIKEKRVVTYNPSLAKKQLLEIEKLARKASELCLYKAKKDEFGECSKYVDFKGIDGTKASVSLNIKKIEEDRKLCGYNLMVTSELNLSPSEIYKIYHNLWRIEESFRIMKSELDARPVYLQKKNTIYGHFLICYLAVLLTRVVQIHELKDQNSYAELFKFIRNFRLVKNKDLYINMATSTEFINKLGQLTKLPLTDAVLTQRKFDKIMNFKI